MGISPFPLALAALAAATQLSARQVWGPGRSPAMTVRWNSLSIQGPLHLLDPEAFDDVAGAHVLVALEGHAAFLADLDFPDFVLEALERRERAFVDDDVVANETHLGTT